MHHQPLDVVAGLGLDLGGEEVLGVGGTGEREVLPDEQAELVARVVEGVVLVDASAPHPHEVGAGGDGALRAAREPGAA